MKECNSNIRLNHNLLILFEDYTIYYDNIDDNKKILSFHSFSRGSENWIIYNNKENREMNV